MRRLLWSAALVASLVTPALPARAELDAAAAATNGLPATIDVPRLTIAAPPPARPMPYLRPLLYALQAVDASVTSRALRTPRRYEANPLMAPFSHGGVPTLALGFALGDVARAQLFRRRPQTARMADAGQALFNLDGILQTGRALRAP